MRIHKGDKVLVRTGKYRGRKADVVRAIPSQDKVVLDGVNVAKRSTKPTRTTMQGGIIDKAMPIHVSSVTLLCSACNEPTRVSMDFDDSGRKIRTCRKCGNET